MFLSAEVAKVPQLGLHVDTGALHVGEDPSCDRRRPRRPAAQFRRLTLAVVEGAQIENLLCGLLSHLDLSLSVTTQGLLHRQHGEQLSLADFSPAPAVLKYGDLDREGPHVQDQYGDVGGLPRKVQHANGEATQPDEVHGKEEATPDRQKSPAHGDDEHAQNKAAIEVRCVGVARRIGAEADLVDKVAEEVVVAEHACERKESGVHGPIHLQSEGPQRRTKRRAPLHD
mmetsp:Transcript_88683/g.248140  ORF Transcript_88683/g.248140 Transcript_88683/m.248140 type:complete len:228 (+) Transcript_88683:398-1081(+)